MVDKDPWAGDLLNFASVGAAYTNLIQSLTDRRTISIEAGFGRGKTFFREAWAAHLRLADEIVVEIDAQQTDHSGDPVVTFLGALTSLVPPQDKTKAQKIADTGKKYSVLAAKTVTHIIARNAAEELIGTVTESAADQVEGFEVLEETLDDIGDGLSKMAGQLIAAQLAAEQVRKDEMPKQLDALHQAITKGDETKRIIILIDELDRCHPDYAIAVLEAMKLVFDHPGFVFCLFVNAEYLENLAARRFGDPGSGERYLDKFLDIRLALPVERESIISAARSIATDLPLNIAYGDDPEFTVDRAARLAGELAHRSGFSMRQIERVLLRVELALRCYRDEPLDCALLVFLAFKKELKKSNQELEETYLPRASLTPAVGAEKMTPPNQILGESHFDTERRWQHANGAYVGDVCPELTNLPRERYRLPDNGNPYEWALVLKYLAPQYLPTHEKVIDSVLTMQAAQ